MRRWNKNVNFVLQFACCVLLLYARRQNTQDIWCHVQTYNWINSYAKRATNLSHNLFCNVLDFFFSTCLYTKNSNSNRVYLYGFSRWIYMHTMLFTSFVYNLPPKIRFPLFPAAGICLCLSMFVWVCVFFFLWVWYLP